MIAMLAIEMLIMELPELYAIPSEITGRNRGHLDANFRRTDSRAKSCTISCVSRVSLISRFLFIV